MYVPSRKRGAGEIEKDFNEKKWKVNENNAEQIKPQPERESADNKQRHLHEDGNKYGCTSPKKFKLISTNEETNAYHENKPQSARVDEYTTQRFVEEVKHGISGFNQFNLSPMIMENQIACKTGRFNYAQRSGDNAYAHLANHTVESLTAEMGRRCFSRNESTSVRKYTHALKQNDNRFEKILEDDRDVEIIKIPYDTIILDDEDDYCEFISYTFPATKQSTPTPIENYTEPRFNYMLNKNIDGIALTTAPTITPNIAATIESTTASTIIPTIAPTTAQTVAASLAMDERIPPVFINILSMFNEPLSDQNQLLQDVVTTLNVLITSTQQLNNNANSLAAVDTVNTASVAVPQLGASSPSDPAQTTLADILAPTNNDKVPITNTSMSNQKTDINIPICSPDEGSEKNKNVRKCPICLDVLGKRPLACTTCGHIFCLKCIKQLMKRPTLLPKLCPTCRKPLKRTGAYHVLFV